jgi:hypothetical protein
MNEVQGSLAAGSSSRGSRDLQRCRALSQVKVHHTKYHTIFYGAQGAQAEMERCIGSCTGAHRPVGDAGKLVSHRIMLQAY